MCRSDRLAYHGEFIIGKIGEAFKTRGAVMFGTNNESQLWADIMVVASILQTHIGHSVAYYLSQNETIATLLSGPPPTRQLLGSD